MIIVQSTAEEYIRLSTVILALAESVIPWDLFICKATLLAVVDLQHTLSYVTVSAKTVPIGTTIEIHFMA